MLGLSLCAMNVLAHIRRGTFDIRGRPCNNERRANGIRKEAVCVSAGSVPCGLIPHPRAGYREVKRSVQKENTSGH